MKLWGSSLTFTPINIEGCNLMNWLTLVSSVNGENGILCLNLEGTNWVNKVIERRNSTLIETSWVDRWGVSLYK